MMKIRNMNIETVEFRRPIHVKRSLEIKRLKPFAITATRITGEVFTETARGGLYCDKQFWTQQGWDWKVQNNICGPTTLPDELAEGEKEHIIEESPARRVSIYEIEALIRFINITEDYFIKELAWRGEITWRLPTAEEIHAAIFRRPDNLYPVGILGDLRSLEHVYNQKDPWYIPGFGAPLELTKNANEEIWGHELGARKLFKVEDYGERSFRIVFRLVSSFYHPDSWREGVSYSFG
jgi:hypothetical protein